MSETPEDLAATTFVVWLLSRNQTTDLRAALAWLIRNRACQAKKYVERCSASHPKFGNGSMVEAAKSVLSEVNPNLFVQSVGEKFAFPPYASRSYLSVLATVCWVLNKEIEDSTQGALYFHHHLENPAWAVRAEPNALIGPFFFYDQVLRPKKRSSRIISGSKDEHRVSTNAG